MRIDVRVTGAHIHCLDSRGAPGMHSTFSEVLMRMLRSLLAARLNDHTKFTPTRTRRHVTLNYPIEFLEPRQFLSATQLVFLTVPATGFLGSSLGQIVVNLDDAGGNVVSNDDSKVTLSIHSGPDGGKIIGKVTVNAVAGAATFASLKLSALGTYTFSATDATENLTNLHSANVLVEAPPVATSLVISQPANNTAGSMISTVTVQVKDQYGNLFTGGHPMVSLTLVNPAAGAKLLGHVSAAAANGTATFTGLSLNEAGTFELRASDGSGSHALSMTTQTFSVTSPAVATSLVFVQNVTNLTAGATMAAVTVKVVDQYGNVVTSDHSTIKLTDPAGPQSRTFTAHVVSGIATFPTISFEQAGTYTLHATDARTTDGHPLSLTDLTTFTVSAAAANHLVFQQLPANNTAHAGPFTVEAAVADQFGNVVTTNTSTVTLALASGPADATLPLTAQADAGIATFPGVAFTSAGHYRLAATDGALKAAASAPFTLT
jgi:hypothetical protein